MMPNASSTNGLSVAVLLWPTAMELVPDITGPLATASAVLGDLRRRALSRRRFAKHPMHQTAHPIESHI